MMNSSLQIKGSGLFTILTPAEAHLDVNNSREDVP